MYVYCYTDECEAFFHSLRIILRLLFVTLMKAYVKLRKEMSHKWIFSWHFVRNILFYKQFIKKLSWFWKYQESISWTSGWLPAPMTSGSIDILIILNKYLFSNWSNEEICKPVEDGELRSFNKKKKRISFVDCCIMGWINWLASHFLNLFKIRYIINEIADYGDYPQYKSKL